MSWPDFWQQVTWKTRLLMPLSSVACALARSRWRRFQQTATAPLSPPVLVVGNVVVGGTGKTPMLMWLMEQCQQQGIAIGIVSRGYGATIKGEPIDVKADHMASQVGDEPLMLKQFAVHQLGLSASEMPIVVHPKRKQAYDYLVQHHRVDWVISDDGLQHFALPRQWELVMQDERKGWGNGWCLPAGPLREPLQRLHHVNGLCLTTDDWEQVNELIVDENVLSYLPQTALGRMGLKPHAWQSLIHETQGVMVEKTPLPPVVQVSDQVHVVCALGSPQRFYDTLKRLGLQWQQVVVHEFADHHQYQTSDFDWMGLGDVVLMSEKDGVKCRDIARELADRQLSQWWMLQVKPVVSDPLARRLMAVLQETGS